MNYPVTIERDGETWMVSFPDVPEALTCGDTREEALREALDALVTSFEFYFEGLRPVPMPSAPEDGQDVVTVPHSLWAKVLLLNAMCESSVSQTELGKRLGIPRQNVQRLTDLHHATKIDQLAAAVKVLGHRLELVIR
ncbi:type II toxin-antitoxin system HicB family antitoxin [Aeromonas aquatica]|uniref:type II toxin-antitoxin system HicB family antitoxin n=1 Tax=Aeromonas aquatica TaxID=558964 RepID=UPI00051BEE63|nr:type II toxin-antitoxin system HicB family antitoxin [Aeromonas aquatica]